MLMLIEVPPCRPLSKQFKRVCCAPVAQMDRALASGAKGRGFESLLARHLFPGPARRHGLHNAPGAHSMPRTAQGATAGRASTNAKAGDWKKIGSDLSPHVHSGKRWLN